MASNRLKDVQDRLELVRQLHELVPYGQQPRELMKDQLALAISDVNTHLHEMERVEDMKPDGYSDD